MKRLWPRSQGRDQTSWALETQLPDWKGMGLSEQRPFPAPKMTGMAYEATQSHLAAARHWLLGHKAPHDHAAVISLPLQGHPFAGYWEAGGRFSFLRVDAASYLRAAFTTQRQGLGLRVSDGWTFIFLEAVSASVTPELGLGGGGPLVRAEAGSP